MIVNEQKDYSCLLSWLASERSALGHQPTVFTLDQALPIGILPAILRSASPSYFDGTDAGWDLDRIEAYLENVLGKKLNWKLRQLLHSKAEGWIPELMKLVCYICIHSDNKNGFIERIFELGEEAQKYLMEELQLMEGRLQNIVQIREILQQVELLEKENVGMRQSIERLSLSLTRLSEYNKELLEENCRFKAEAHQLRMEKSEIMTLLDIDNIQHYAHLYQSLKNQHDSSLSLIRDLEEKLSCNDDNCRSLLNRINSDCEVITQLSEELQRYRSLYIESKQSQNDITMNSSIKTNVLRSLCLSNKENSSQRLHSGRNRCFEDPEGVWTDGEPEVSNIKLDFDDSEMEQRLLRAKNQNQKMQELVESLKEKNMRLRKRRSKHERLIREIMDLRDDFVERYFQIKPQPILLSVE